MTTVRLRTAGGGESYDGKQAGYIAFVGFEAQEAANQVMQQAEVDEVRVPIRKNDGTVWENCTTIVAE